MRTIGDDVIAVGAIVFGGLVCTGATLWCLERIPASRAPGPTEAPRPGRTIDHAIIRDLSEEYPEALDFAVIRDINEPVPGAIAFAPSAELPLPIGVVW